MKTLLIYVLSLACFIAYSQSADVDVVSERTETGFTVKAINNTDVQREFTVTLDVHNLKGYTKPIVKLVPAKTTVKLIDLTKTPNEYNNLKYKFSHKAVPAKTEKKDFTAREKSKVMSDLGISDKGIYVFVKEECSRCKLATAKLKEQNIEYKLINVTNNADANGLMWKLMRLDNPKVKRIGQPVFVVDGKISHSLEDVEAFVDKLK